MLPKDASAACAWHRRVLAPTRQIVLIIVCLFESVLDNNNEQAGAELCQAQTQICMHAEAELILKIEFQISA